jgi:hypothetical protein
VIDSSQRTEFFKQVHLFRGLEEEALLDLSQNVPVQVYSPGQVIFRQGDEGDEFFLLCSGRVSESRQKGEEQRLLADLGPGDHFGEDALFKKSHRPVTITVKESAVVLIISRSQLDSLLKQFPLLRSRFEIALSSLHLLVRRRFTWLVDGEAVHFVTQRHPILLLKALLWPVMGLLVPAISLSLYLITPLRLFLWVAALSFLVSLAFGFWKWVDWGNETYVVTNKRVLAIRKVILLYESRQEAPLTTILSVHSQSDVIGRAFGYGDVIIRTYVGNVTFTSINHPEETEGLLHEYWKRTEKGSSQVDMSAWRASLRQKMDLEQPLPPLEEDVKSATRPAYTFNLFKVRFEEHGIITYRKHWFVLVKQTWLPGLLTLLGIVLMLRDLFMYGFNRSDFALIEIAAPLTILAFLWWLYQVIDWSNDRFQVSGDEIFDIDRKPLGRSTRNVAPLGNILNLESRRKNPLQILFNYGDVFISVGGSNMVFEDVMKPDEVQQDIEERRMALKQRLEHERELAERERLATYIADYHNEAASLRAEQEEKKRQDQAGSQSGDPSVG